MINHTTITETLADLLPGDVELVVTDNTAAYVAHFNWPIDSDPSRPYKRSKTVLLKIHENAMRDLSHVGNKLEAKTLIDLETYFKNKLKMFQPDHNRPKGKAEPIEKWEVASLHFLGTQKPVEGVERRMF